MYTIFLCVCVFLSVSERGGVLSNDEQETASRAHLVSCDTNFMLGDVFCTFFVYHFLYHRITCDGTRPTTETFGIAHWHAQCVSVSRGRNGSRPPTLCASLYEACKSMEAKLWLYAQMVRRLRKKDTLLHNISGNISTSIRNKIQMLSWLDTTQRRKRLHVQTM